MEKLSTGVLSQFSGLKELEAQLEQITTNQQELFQNISEMNIRNEDFMEVQLLVREKNWIFNGFWKFKISEFEFLTNNQNFELVTNFRNLNFFEVQIFQRIF